MTATHPHLTPVRDGSEYHVQCDHPDHDHPVLSVGISRMALGELEGFVNDHDHDDLPPAA